MNSFINKEVEITDEMVQRAIVVFRSREPFTKEILERLNEFRLYDTDKQPLGFARINKKIEQEGGISYLGVVKYREEEIIETFDFKGNEIIEKPNKIYLVHTVPFIVRENSNYIMFKKIKANKFINNLSEFLFSNSGQISNIRFDLGKIEKAVLTQGFHTIVRHKYVQKNSRIRNKIEGGSDIQNEADEYKTCDEVDKEYIGLEMAFDLLITVIVNANGYFLIFRTWKDIIQENYYLDKIWEELKQFHFILTSDTNI